MIKQIINYLKKSRFCKKKVTIGKNTRILCRWTSFGSEPYLIEIGNNCTVTSGVKFITHDGSIDVPFNLQNKKRWQGEKKYEKLGKIIIKDNCFIGMNSIILPNVVIEENSIVAAGAVVVKSFPANSIIGGNPAKIIGDTSKYYEKIKDKVLLINHGNKEKEILDKINFLGGENEKGN